VLKVLHVIPSVAPSEGGPSYAVFAFARAAKMAGAETLIVTTGNDESDHDIECLCFQRNSEAYKISFSLRRWLDRHVGEFDLVHIHALFSFSSRAAAHAAQKHGVPYVIRPLGVLNRWGLGHRRRFLKKFWLRFIELPILKSAAAIHYTSQAELDEAAQIGESIAQLPSFITPIPVLPGTSAWGGFSEDEFLRKYPETRGKQIVLFLARLDRKKGVDVLLQSFPEIKRKHADAVLVIAGSGQQIFGDELRRQAQSLEIANEIIWPGFLSGGEKAAALAAATIYVLPSYSENFGIAAAEALAAGVPTVLSDQVAISQEAAAANAAMVVRPEPAEIARAIGELLDNSSTREELRRNAKLFAQRAFSPERVSEQLVAEYRKILNRGQ
jgi:glycosyltransferase involved in cell wall biosynthesis